MKYRDLVPYADSPECKDLQITTMFNRIAPKYDRLNRVLSLGLDQIWRKRLVEMTMVSQPNCVLDLATGTGDVAFQLVKNAKTKVIAIDPSAEMLRRANEKLEKNPYKKGLSFQLGNAHALAFDDNSFDAITVSFGVRNFEYLELGLKECLRVLKPSGRLVVLEFTRPNIPFLKWGYRFYSSVLLTRIGGWLSGDRDAYKYLNESALQFPERDAFLKISEECGFKPIHFKTLNFGICAIYVLEKGK